jgi:hypothetical protein
MKVGTVGGLSWKRIHQVSIRNLKEKNPAFAKVMKLATCSHEPPNSCRLGGYWQQHDQEPSPLFYATSRQAGRNSIRRLGDKIKDTVMALGS